LCFQRVFACVIGGWIAAKIAGIRRSETAMLHGAVAWLVAVPVLILLAALGAGSYFGGWHGSLAGNPARGTLAAAPLINQILLTLPPLRKNAKQAPLATYRADARSLDTGDTQGYPQQRPAVSALLIGLIGSAMGGWMASGEVDPKRWTRKRVG
jgi:hypothetical protein